MCMRLPPEHREPLVGRAMPAMHPPSISWRECRPRSDLLGLEPAAHRIDPTHLAVGLGVPGSRAWGGPAIAQAPRIRGRSGRSDSGA